MYPDSDDEQEEHEQGVEGTDLFAAPETRMGDLSVFEEASDIWATGVIAYQLLTRRNPFEDKGVWPINYRDLNWKANHFANSPYVEHLSDDSKDFLMKLLSYEPERRPTAEEALKHPWFQCCEKTGNRIKKQTLNSALVREVPWTHIVDSATWLNPLFSISEQPSKFPRQHKIGTGYSNVYCQ